MWRDVINICFLATHISVPYIAAVQVVPFLGVGGVIDEIGDGLGTLGATDGQQELDGARPILQLFYNHVGLLFLNFRKINGSSDERENDLVHYQIEYCHMKTRYLFDCHNNLNHWLVFHIIQNSTGNHFHKSFDMQLLG